MPAAVSTCRKRRPTRRRHSQQPLCLCWRNPFCVFLVSFLAIGSLRFRERKHHRNIDNKMLARRNPNDNEGGAAPIELEYEIVEEGTTPGGSEHSFVKYRVMDKTNRQEVSVLQWAQTLAGSSSHDDDNNDKSMNEQAAPSISSTHDSASAAAAAVLQFNQLLAAAPYQAFYWETRPILRGDVATASRTTMEFVLVDAPELYAFARNKPDASTFAKQFRNKNSPSWVAAASALVAIFDNIGKDAKLVAPKPPPGIHQQLGRGTLSSSIKKLNVYSDLAAFCRGAPSSQVQALWRTVAQQYLLEMSSSASGDGANNPVWLSTSGGGVAWLHVRFDTRPKYYTYKPYTTPPGTVGASSSDKKNGIVAKSTSVSRRVDEGV